MLDVVRRGFALRNFYKKEWVKNSKWYLHVYKPEVKRLTQSIVRLEKKALKLVRRIKDITEELNKLSNYSQVIHFK
jgi:hypothetical protein